jgi:DNA-binding MarR family transcriptional regulator
MPVYPSLSTQVIGQAESALGAVLAPVLAAAGTTMPEWLVLTVTAASGPAAESAALIARISSARKTPGSETEAALRALTAAVLLQPVPGDRPRVALTAPGRARYQGMRAALEAITARLFDGIPAGDLAVAGRVLGIVTARADAELAGGLPSPAAVPPDARASWSAVDDPGVVAEVHPGRAQRVDPPQ